MKWIVTTAVLRAAETTRRRLGSLLLRVYLRLVFKFDPRPNIPPAVSWNPAGGFVETQSSETDGSDDTGAGVGVVLLAIVVAIGVGIVWGSVRFLRWAWETPLPF